MRTRIISAVLIGLMLGIIAPAKAEFANPQLDTALSYFAERPVKVVCRTPEEDLDLNWAWAYVIASDTAKRAYVLYKLCNAALAIPSDDPAYSDWMKGMAVQVIVHEAFHLKHTKGRHREDITECRAFLHMDEGLDVFGASLSVKNRLMPIMIGDHFRYVSRNPRYNYKACPWPKRYNKYWDVREGDWE